MKEYLMGNAAMAVGALCAGVNVACGYPGTPSSEIIENIAARKQGSVYVEWSVNEKAAMEVAAGAAYSGARAIVTMKQMGLNVASDPLMCLAYVGVKGGLVVVAADDPGPISSQTEQDTREFARFAGIPIFDPSSPEEAFTMIQEAFECSERYFTPVLFRPTTRICHAYAPIEYDADFTPRTYEGFVKDSSRWVIFPKLANENHAKIVKRNRELAKRFSMSKLNYATGQGTRAVFASGVSYAYALEYLQDRTAQDVKLVKISTPYPFPDDFAASELDGVTAALCLEELSSYMEDELWRVVGERHLPVNVYGRETGHVPVAGEYSADIAARAIGAFLGDKPKAAMDLSDRPALPPRPPVLCAGCPHRASFYAVKTAMAGRKAYYCGDIGCYTLGNAMPLDMVDTCLCMGAGITVAQGFAHTDPDAVSFAFVGDSTFFASGLTGVANAVYNEADIVICVLDNSTTAMTGHQPHPGTGHSLMGGGVRLDIARILEAMGVASVVTVNPFDLEAAISAVRDAADMTGVRAIIFKAPCVALCKPSVHMQVSDLCVNCHACISKLGCPAISATDTGVAIDESLCTGCGLCAAVCPASAIGVAHE